MPKRQTKLNLSEITDILQGKLIGEGEHCVWGLASLKSAGPNHISFLSSDKFLDDLKSSSAGAVLLNEKFSDGFDGNKIIVDDPYLCFAVLSKLFDPRDKRPKGVHPSATVDPSSQIDATASIGPHCWVGADTVVGPGVELYAGVSVAERCQIAANTLIYSNVSIYSDVEIGESCIIHANTTIGSDGFGFAPSKEGWVKIHQLGGVKVGNRVEIGANTAIDRGAIEDTVIADGVIIDNQVHIAHNVQVGEGTALAGCVGIAGSTTLGRNCIVAGAVAINGHIEVADNTQFHGGTIVTRGNTEAGVFASAPPLQDVVSWRKNSVRYRQLDKLAQRVKALESKSSK